MARQARLPKPRAGRPAASRSPAASDRSAPRRSGSGARRDSAPSGELCGRSRHVSSAVLRCDPTPVGDRITFEDDRDELRLFGSSPRKLATLRRCYDVLMESRLEWRGLWHPTARPRWWLRLVVYVIVPLVLVLLVGDLRRFGAKYLGAFIVSVAISASFE